MRGLVFDIETVRIQIHPFYNNYFSVKEKIALEQEYDRYKLMAQERGQIDPFISHPPFNAIVAIAWALVEEVDGEIIVRKRGGNCHTDEKKLVGDFIQYINLEKPDLYIHFNGKGFDVPMIIFKALFYGIKITHKKFLNLYRYSNEHHYDLKDVVTTFGTYPLNLRTLSISLKNGDPKEDCAGNDVEKLWKGKSYSSIETYCKGDVTKTLNNFTQIYKLIK